MITFDPTALGQPARSLADAAREDAAAAAVVAQVTRGAVTVQVGSGLADLDRPQPAPAQGAYEIGSQTKMMTAVLILQLVEQGLIDLDAPAAEYLPASLIRGIENADVATVRQLLNMTAGIGNYTDAVGPDGIPLFIAALLEHPDRVFGPDEALDVARDMQATGAPGADYYYSNTNYLLLGQIIETLTGQDYYQALQARIFDPSGMEHSVRQLTTGDDRLSSYATLPDGTVVDVTRALWEMRGEAGVVSTNADMTRFLQALLVDKSLLGQAALDEMTDFFTTDTGPGFQADFGLGLARIVLDGGSTFVGFTGGTLGTGSSTYLELDTGAIVSVAGTSADVDSVGAALMLWQASQGGLWERDAVTGAVSVASVSAADLRLAGGAAMSLSAQGVTLTTARDLRAVTLENLRFADGSVMLVGDMARGTARDQVGNRIDVATAAPGAMDKDNHLMGLRGDDSLRGGDGADWLQGGKGADDLHGGAGDDILAGGRGADVFVFGPADTGHDTIRGFDPGQDRIDLSALTGVDVTLRQGGILLSAGDLTVVLHGVSHLDPGDLIL